MQERFRLMTFAVVGGGPTGVELAGAIADMARFALSRDFRRIDPRAARIVLLEAGPRLLSTFPEALSRYAEQTLRRMGVDVRTSTAVSDVNTNGVETTRGTVRTGCVVWAAGIRASPAAQWIEADAGRSGRIKVQSNLSVVGEPNIFAIGDTAEVIGPDGTFTPGIAPAAKQMGKYVGRLIGSLLRHGTSPPAFAYRHAGDLAAIGRKAAIVSIGRFQLTGFLAWVFWGIAHIYYLIGARNRLIVALDWLWEYVTFQRGARLINECSLERGLLSKRGGQ
jgi:NADH dehydrogenase